MVSASTCSAVAASTTARSWVSATVNGVGRLDHQRQRIVRRLDDVDRLDPDACSSGSSAAGWFSIDDQGIEEFGDADGLLDVGERHVVVLEQRRLRVGEAADHRRRWIRPAVQRVRAGTVLISRPTMSSMPATSTAATGDRGAEDHVGAPGEPADRDTPRRTDDGADGDAASGGPAGDARGDLGGQLGAHLAEAGVAGRLGGSASASRVGSSMPASSVRHASSAASTGASASHCR